MGTRHLTVVILDKQFRLAQYGQFDGYPSARGIELLNLIKEIPRKAFEAKLRASKMLTDDELDTLQKEVDALASDARKDWWKTHPQFDREISVEVLDFINSSPPGIMLKNSITFACDTVFCEWCYVLDLDNNRFEVYTGFNEIPLTNKDRFHFLDTPEIRAREGANPKYYPVRLKAEWPLDQLPSAEDFLNTSDPKEE